MVEMIMVMVIVGILAVSGLSRFNSANSFDERGFYDEVLSSLHYAHRLASIGGCHLRVEINSGLLTLSQWASCTPSDHSLSSTAVTHPQNRGTFSTAIPNNLSTGTLDIYFDGHGRPYTTSTESLTSAVTTVAIGSRTVSIEAETGYAH